MSESQSHEAPESLGAALRLMESMVAGKWACQAVYVAAELGIPDLLKDGPRGSAEIARAAGAADDATYRLLRALTALGVLTELPERRFELTEMGGHLRRDARVSLHGYVRFIAFEATWRAWGNLIHSVRTGKPAFDHVFGMPAFEYVAKHPDFAAIFNEAMASMTTLDSAAVVEAYDFTSIRTLVDVGGGHGALLASVLKANPKMTGVLVDMPHAAAGATSLFQREGLADRCRFVSGNFLEAVPAGGDAYLMKHVIHDWDDAQALQILRSCHQAMSKDAVLLVVDMVLPTANQPHVGKLQDLSMLVLTHGGRERTEQEFSELFDAAGFELRRVVPTRVFSSVLEGVKR